MASSTPLLASLFCLIWGHLAAYYYTLEVLPYEITALTDLLNENGLRASGQGSYRKAFNCFGPPNPSLITFNLCH
ncbi:hypothetical protein DER45DRAFT_552229 [Fusarium avenaceum]|nr:hypothetical protein DER45DRAFT_552229 [Fusarium avenaceum]